MVTCKPEVYVTKLDKDFEFIILACDGIWDMMSNEQAIEFLHKNCYNDQF